jgi:hypothetical protein
MPVNIQGTVTGNNINIGGNQNFVAGVNISNSSTQQYEEYPKQFTVRLRFHHPELEEDVVYDIEVEADGITETHFARAARKAQIRVNTKNLNGPVVWRVHSIKEIE